MRDVTKVLSEAEILKLRELLRDAPTPSQDYVFGDYPKMLFAPGWFQLYVIIKEEPDPLKVKGAKEQIRKHQLIVDNIEDEEDYLTDGWVNDPNVFATEVLEKDPRVPDGRAGRMAAKDVRAARERELTDIRRRYAQLTGRRLVEDDLETPAAQDVAVAEDPIAEVPVELVADKVQRVKDNAKRAARG